MSYTCRNCGAQSEKDHRLCNAVKTGTEDNFCGIPEEWICGSMLPTLKYTCQTCGAVSAQTDTLCNPTKNDV